MSGDERERHVDELNRCVTEAIGLAERLESSIPRQARAAWVGVAQWERRLADLLPADDPEGRIARRGTVSALLNAGRRDDAARFLNVLRADPATAPGDIAACSLMIEEVDAAWRRRYPALSRNGHSDAMGRYVLQAESNPNGFLEAA